jgi:hypothetical protein
MTVAYPVLVDPALAAGYGVSAAEARYCALPWHWDECKQARTDANRALAKAEELFDDSTLYLGVGDAFRHCFWNARMEISIGHDAAYEIATRHESADSGASKEMDLKNNKIGRKIGGNAVDKDHPVRYGRKRCYGHAVNEKLYIVVNGNVVLGS